MNKLTPETTMLYFMEETDGAFDAANDGQAYPLSAFRGWYGTGTTTTIKMQFDPLIAHNAATTADSVTLTITANKQKEVIQDVTRAMNEGPHSDGFIVISDDSNSVFASQYITGCENFPTAI